ncbi:MULTISPECIES: LPXTG cell wall anchor domain-containing protein [unclassified Streptomyces]|uniref:LPXTG cell wall anchor domain-containing protein n=1 Tax=unclassified Streptomyces TaxID=2593676 RepID=UPI0006F9746B|nr:MULTISPECIES: LPXTG cell wall anchor domain-containing protein [unclassified Streptomyces]KQX57875.1 hypothetical protein ASD33_25565 [Streptomyces sp. Root1304]KRA78759.1 hypothetical protein ASE09_23120 [Streptomyces sp. Root66D1]
MRRSFIPAAALVAAMAGSLALAPVASASEGPKPLPLHQADKLPLTASDWKETEKVCGNVPTDQDGWHFVLPGRSATFSKLTVEFQPGGVQTVTVFGPPDAKHAYVGSEPGAKLISASAEINGTVTQGWFNLSHTCPTAVKPTPTGTPSTTAPTPTDTPTTEAPTGTPSGTPSQTPSSTVSPTDSPSSSVSPTDSPSSSVSPTATNSAGQPVPSASGSSSTGGDLAETGSSTPVGLLAAVALALAGAGAYLVTRRRKAQQH